MSEAETHLRGEVIRRMKADIAVPDDRLSISVQEGVVTILGTVAHDAQRDAAEQCAQGVPGVRQVINRIEVNPASVTAE